MLPSNRRPAARSGESAPRENAIFPTEETSTGSTVRALPNGKKKEREPTLIGLGIADRLGHGTPLESGRMKAPSPAVAKSDARAPQQAAASEEDERRDSTEEATTRFERDLADTCEVSIVEMQVLPKSQENLAEAFGTYPQLSTIAQARNQKPRWWEGERGFTVALVATSLCAMLALVLVATSRTPDVSVKPPAAEASATTGPQGKNPAENSAIANTPAPPDPSAAETAALPSSSAADAEAKPVAPAEKKRVTRAAKKRRKARREDVRGSETVSAKLR